MLDTENEYFEVSRELVNARHDLESAKAEVMAILGRLTGNQMVDGAYVEAMNSVDLSEHSTDELAPYCVFNLPAEMDVDGFELYAQELEETGRAIVYGINFAFDSADIEPSSESVLLDVLAVLNNDSGLALTIEGHTDSTGDNDYNLDLSQRRAQSVVDWLIANGVAVGRLNALGYGEERPVADNATAEGRAANRRVELKK